MSEEIKAMKVGIEATAKTYNGIKALVSGVMIEDKQEQKQVKPSTSSVFGDAFKTK